MARLYVETSALGRVLAEPDANAIRAVLRAYDERLSSALLLVELRRLAIREGLTSIADRMLGGVQLLSVSAEVWTALPAYPLRLQRALTSLKQLNNLSVGRYSSQVV